MAWWKWRWMCNREIRWHRESWHLWNVRKIRAGAWCHWWRCWRWRSWRRICCLCIILRRWRRRRWRGKRHWERKRCAITVSCCCIWMIWWSSWYTCSFFNFILHWIDDIIQWRKRNRIAWWWSWNHIWCWGSGSDIDIAIWQRRRRIIWFRSWWSCHRKWRLNWFFRFSSFGWCKNISCCCYGRWSLFCNSFLCRRRNIDIWNRWRWIRKRIHILLCWKIFSVEERHTQSICWVHAFRLTRNKFHLVIRNWWSYMPWCFRWGQKTLYI